MKIALSILLLAFLMPVHAADTASDAPPAFTGPIAFHIFRLADYKALIANRTLEELMRDEGATAKALATGTCLIPSHVNVRTATFGLSFDIRAKRVQDNPGDVTVSYSIAIESEKGAPILSYDTSEAVIHRTWQHASVAFSDDNVKGEYQVAVVFKRIRPTL